MDDTERQTLKERFQRQFAEIRERQQERATEREAPTSRIQELRGQVQERQYREGIQSRDANARTAEYGMSQPELRSYIDAAKEKGVREDAKPLAERQKDYEQRLRDDFADRQLAHMNRESASPSRETTEREYQGRPKESVREMFQRQLQEARDRQQERETSRATPERSREPTERLSEIRARAQARETGMESAGERAETASRPRETVREMYQRQLQEARTRPPVAQERSRDYGYER